MRTVWVRCNPLRHAINEERAVSMSRVSPWTVRRRLALGFGFVTLLALLSALAGFWGLDRSEAAMRTMYADRVLPLRQLSQIQHELSEARSALQQAVLVASPPAAGAAVKRLEAAQATIDRVWRDYMSTTLTAEEAVLARRFDEARALLLRDGLQPLSQTLAEGRFDDARPYASGVLQELSSGVDQPLAALLELQVKVSAQEFAAAQSAGSRSSALMVGLVLAVLGGAALTFALTTRHLTRALGAEPSELAAAAARIAEGSLQAPARRAAVAGSVMASMDAMREALVSVVSTVRHGVDSVATASSQIAQGNADLSSRTEEQASSLQQTAASMEQLTGTVRSGADSATQANALAREASQAATEGGEVVAQVVQTMGAIQASSSRINEITGVIDGIAFQTNILALNAAVEAARAGEQGRGFAVVAAEVRTLAQRSAEAAREIKRLIDDSASQVDEGHRLVQKAGETMAGVVNQVRQVSELMTQVSHATVEQTQGIDQINVAVGQLDQATQQNAALVEESAAAAESLKAQAARLAASVAVFRLDVARA
jgi:methyl-accepting chemotaxis protein